MQKLKILSCSVLLMMSMLSCQDDTLDFERIHGFEIAGAKAPLKGFVGDSLEFSFSAENSHSAIIEPLAGSGQFFLDGILLEQQELNSVPLGQHAVQNKLVYVPMESGEHTGRVIFLNSSLQRDTLEYDIAVSVNIPDYNARVHRDTATGKYMLYIKQQPGEEVPTATYLLQLKGDNSAELRVKVGGGSIVYRVGDKIPVEYSLFMQNGYTIPVELELISTTKDAYSVDFIVIDENDKTVTIKKTINLDESDEGSVVDPAPEVSIPDFNTRVFSADSSTFNMYLKQQGDEEDPSIQYSVYLEAGFNDNDVEMEIYFAGREMLYRLGDIIKVEYSIFQTNDNILPFEIKVIEAARETYQLRFIVEDQSGKKMTVIKEYSI